MKGSGKIILAVSFMTALLLGYVHEQIALLRISYLMDTQSELLARESEQYRHLKYEVDQLKAPRLLEAKLKDLSLDLTLPKEFRVLPAPALDLQQKSAQNLAVKPLSTGFSEFLGRWVNIAQAKTDS